jgi:hypothetical protein
MRFLGIDDKKRNYRKIEGHPILFGMRRLITLFAPKSIYSIETGKPNYMRIILSEGHLYYDFPLLEEFFEKLKQDVDGDFLGDWPGWDWKTVLF